jgi:hypothetical protein
MLPELRPRGADIATDVDSVAKGEPHHWASLGGDAQKGALSVMFDGSRVNPTYDPMRKQGAILLGNGGDNSVGSQGTFYEGAVTAAGTFIWQRCQISRLFHEDAQGAQVINLSILPR